MEQSVQEFLMNLFWGLLPTAGVSYNTYKGEFEHFFYSLYHLYIEHYVNIKVIISYYTTNNNNIAPSPNIDYLYIK